MIEIPLSQGLFARIDDEDCSLILGISWYALRTKEGFHYAIGNEPMIAGVRRKIKMHRYVMGLESNDPRVVDHIDRNRLNNCKSNLRICEQKQNSRNRPASRSSTGYKGVFWRKSRNHYISKIVVDGRTIYLGSSNDPYKLHCVYREAAMRYHGEFANFDVLQKGT